MFIKEEEGETIDKKLSKKSKKEAISGSSFPKSEGKEEEKERSVVAKKPQMSLQSKLEQKKKKMEIGE